jgi:hypothetical protein
MPNTQRPKLASVFDEMLTQNKKRFDDLYVRRRPDADELPPMVKAPFAPEKAAVSSPIASPSIRLDPASPAMRRLNERFGADWRYEIAEQQRDGDEAIVLCKLFLGKSGTVKTHFGRAKVSHAPAAGAADGLRFKFASGGAEQDERNAFRRALEAALMNCIELI